MAWRCGSLQRSLISTARASSSRSAPSLPRLRRPPPPLPGHRIHSRRTLSSIPRTTGVLGCTQSLLPLHSVVASAHLTSHIAVEVRSCCELCHGT
ncbi:Protein NUCLEAR FUSION DEFECTIVE 6 like [Actinidia chinensis var. chinensis]|uniref:Protein NUCLEAR FUSION DEFECTIVE 6 like n=1 Tax=Actinidia chinensis var. chinensis TaxID=1590841 RepID=A0A2R6S1C5_ACTCC|nr:Protein NUCLEAR FUSION DEFECTIVE 6 like [Actinidia chinensis var. chinensis]